MPDRPDLSETAVEDPLPPLQHIMSALDAYPEQLAAKVDKELITTGRADCRPCGLTIGLYNTPGKPGVSLVTPKPAGVEREWAASAGHYVPQPPPVKVMRKSTPERAHQPRLMAANLACVHRRPARTRSRPTRCATLATSALATNRNSGRPRVAKAGERVFSRTPKPFVDEYGVDGGRCRASLTRHENRCGFFLFTSAGQAPRAVILPSLPYG